MPTVTSSYANGSGSRLWWRKTDPGTQALPLVLLHGGPGMPAYYLEPLEALADERPVVVYDQAGCGRSAAPEDSAVWTLESMVADLDLVVSELGLEQFHLLGHSWGGMLALAYSSSYPHKVASLILGSPLVSVERWCADAAELVNALPPGAQQALTAPAASDEYAEAEAEFYRRHFCRLDPWPSSLQRTMEEVGTDVYNTMWGPNEFTLAGNLKGTDLTPVVRALSVPNLWLCGTEDEARPGTIREFSEMNPRGRFVEFTGGTHCVHLEQTEDYLSVVRSFLGREFSCTAATS